MAKIMVVEDNALNIKLFCDLLTAHGHQTRGVTDSREAMDTARAFAPELIITDIQLPYIDGMELMGMIRAEAALARVPIMAVTAYAGEGDGDRIIAAGAQAYVEKPISVARFAEAVNGLLEAGPIEASEAEAEAAEAADSPPNENGADTFEAAPSKSGAAEDPADSPEN